MCRNRRNCLAPLRQRLRHAESACDLIENFATIDLASRRLDNAGRKHVEFLFSLSGLMSDGPGHDFGRQTAAAAKAEVRASKLQHPLAILAAAFLTVDFFAPAAMDRVPPEIFSVILFGILPAQFGVLAVLAVVGPGRWPARQVATTVLAALGWLAFGAGSFAIAHAPSDVLEALLRLTALVPLVFLAVQLPLWIGRWLRGWQLAEASAAADQR